MARTKRGLGSPNMSEATKKKIHKLGGESSHKNR